MNQKFFAFGMAVISALTTVTPAAAVPASGDGQSVPVELTVEKPIFSVTVPTGLPVAVDAAGKVYCSTNATIKNNTFGQVKVSDVSIEGNTPWVISPWNMDMQKEKVNSSKIAMELNGGITTEVGYDFKAANFPIMDGHASLPLTYDAKLPAQTKVISGDTVANVVFTVGWNAEDGSSSFPDPLPVEHALESISLNKQATTLHRGSSEQLSVSYNPNNTTEDKSVVWTVQPAGIVSVVNGLVKAENSGEATVIADCHGHKASCIVTVPKELSGITLSEHDITMENGTQHKLTATTKYREVPVWSVIEGNCVTVNDGNVIAKAPGTAKIQVQIGEFKDVCTVHVTQKLNGISLNKSATTINMGETETLSIHYDPTNTTDPKTVTWSVISGSAVTVSNGIITPVIPGTATIQAQVGAYKATCTVTVKAPLQKIELDHTSLTLNKGSEVDLHVTYYPANTTDPKTIKWDSNHNNIVSVVNGHLVASDWGEATITATVAGHTAKCVVTVPKILSGVTLTEHDVEMKNGTQHQLTVNTKYREAPVWSVIEGNCVTVKDGLITPKTFGKAKIQVQVGSFKDVCSVTVIPAPLNPPHATGSPIDKEMMKSRLGELTGSIVFSRDKAPANGTVPINKDGTVVAKIIGQNATVYSKNGGGVFAPQDSSYLFVKRTENNPDGGMQNFGYEATNIDLYGLDTSNMFAAPYMFASTKMKTIDVSNFDTTNLNQMIAMFSGSQATTIKGFSSFDTRNARVTTGMFSFTNVNELDLSSFNTSNIVQMISMFQNCSATTIKGLNNFDISNVENMYSMFKNSHASVLDLSSFDVKNVHVMHEIFRGAKATKVYCRSEIDMQRLFGSANNTIPQSAFVVGKP